LNVPGVADGALSKLNCDGTDVAVAIGDTVFDAGDDDGACVLPPEPNSEGLGVGSGVNVGSAVSCLSLPVGLVVLNVAGVDVGASRFMVNSDGTDVTIEIGANVGETVSTLFPVGLAVVAVAGKEDGALVSPCRPNSEGFDVAVIAGEDVGSAGLRSSLPVGLVVLAGAEDDAGADVPPTMSIPDGLLVATGEGEDVGSPEKRSSLLAGLEILVGAGDFEGAGVVSTSMLNFEGLGVAGDAGFDVGPDVKPVGLVLSVGAGDDNGVAVKRSSLPVGVDVLSCSRNGDGARVLSFLS
jgi:hypothetical protein